MLIIAGLILCILYVFCVLDDEKCGLGIAYGITGLGLWIYVVTELLSLFHILNRVTCITAWVIFDGILFALLIMTIIRMHKISSSMISRISWRLPKNEIISIGVLLVYGLFISSLAIRIVPYNWDSLSYHLSRIWFWAQNEGVGHFVTMDTRMLGTPPFAEFIGIHLYLLYGQSNDAVLNLTQSFSYILNIVLVYSIARRIGCQFKSGLFAAVLFAASPIVFAESLSTQTDEIAALWILIFVRVLLELVYCNEKLRLNKNGIIRLCVLAISLALSILTKPSGLFCVAVMFLWLLYICIKRKDDIKLILSWISLVVIILLICLLPEAAKNILTYGALSDPWQGPGQLVLTLDLRYQVVNFFRNIGYLLPGVLWPSFNRIWQHMIYYLGYILHIDIDSGLINESGNYQDNLINKVENYEYDTATNSVITGLFLVIIIVAIIKTILCGIRRLRKSEKNVDKPVTLGYSTAAFVAFILTCAFVKSEIYVCRYMIAAFGLLAPAISMQIQKLGERRSRLLEGTVYGAAGLLILTQSINMISVHAKHIYSSDERARAYYEVNNSEYEFVYKVLSQYLEGRNLEFHNIGLVMDSNTYVYPILRLLEDYSDTVYYIDVSNASSKYLDDAFQPDCIIVITYADMGDMFSEDYTFNGSKYVQDQQLSGRCRVFVR